MPKIILQLARIDYNNKIKIYKKGHIVFYAPKLNDKITNSKTELINMFINLIDEIAHEQTIDNKAIDET